MRNLAKYPVTKQEMLDALAEAAELFPDDLIGDIRPTAIQAARELIEKMEIPESIFS